MDNKKVLAEIEAALSSDESIPANQVRFWIQSQDHQVQELVSEFFDRGGSRRVDPPLSMDEICLFLREYFRRSLLGHDYVAGFDLHKWFLQLWKDPAVPRQMTDDLKAMLADLYRSGDVPLRTCIVHGTLEHLFEAPEICDEFGDWNDDPVLKPAYAEAMEWGKTFWKTS